MKILITLFAMFFSVSLLAQSPQPLVKTKLDVSGYSEMHDADELYYLDAKTNEYLSKKSYVEKYGRVGFKQLEARINNKTPYKWTLKPVNTIVGGSLIGVSLTTYLVSNNLINSKIRKGADIDKIKSLNNTNEVIGYVCAGVSVAGVIVLLTGLEKEYVPQRGVELGRNFYIDAPAGLSLALTF